MNRTRAKVITSDIETALLPIVRKYGLKSITAGRTVINVSNGSMVVKLEVVEEGGLTPQQAKYNLLREQLGLPALDAEFIFGRQYYKVVGLNKTNKVLAVRVATGRRYRFNVQAVQQALGMPLTDATPRPARRIPARRRSLATETRMERQEQNNEAAEWIKSAPKPPMGFPLNQPAESNARPSEPGKGKFAIDI